MQNEIDQLISQQRFNTYIHAVKLTLGEECRATSLELYEWNAQLAGELMFPFHIFEVTLRNCVAHALELRYGGDWPSNNAFVNSLKRMMRPKFISARNRHYVAGSGAVGKLVTELPLSFYESCFTTAQTPRVWIHKDAFETIFAHAPTVSPTADTATKNIHIHACTSRIHDVCKSIRKLRNRVAHHEPVFNKADVDAVIPGVNELLEWRNPKAKDWFSGKERVSKIIRNGVL